MEFLSPQWCDQLVEAAGAAPATLRDTVIEIQITGAPRGRGRITLEIDGGRLVACRPERAEAAQIELKSSIDDVWAMLQGDLDPNVAFMRGDLKTKGPTGPLLAVLATYRREGFDAARTKLAAATVRP